MKVALAFLLCSYVAESCLPPHIHSVEFDSEYECMIAGYTESLKKLQEIGKTEVNQHKIYLRFICKNEEIILPKVKPKIET